MRVASEKQRTLKEAEAQASMQTQLTNARVQIQIAESQGEADLARARKQAEQTVVTAEAESQQRILVGRGEAQRVLQVGLSEAAVLIRKVASFGDPRLYALSQMTEQLTQSKQPLVPERVFMAGSTGDATGGPGSAAGMLGMLLNLLVAEKSGFQPVAPAEMSGLGELSEQMTRQALASLQQSAAQRQDPETDGNHVAVGGKG